ncbi:hypothetical protein [Streptomyces sp. NPDC097619]|uniref:hypothetical protein n=1 Tax=Streptomyces sp. NPDC097619 TaxID=3157228 RepID=UPI0033190CBB
MARPYRPGPKQFLFAAGDGDDRRVTVADAQEAYEAFSDFFRERSGAASFTVHDEPAGQRLVLVPARGLISRIAEAGPSRADHLHVGRAARCLTGAMLFFENGHTGLEHFGPWTTDPTDPTDPAGASPEARGAARAATFTTEAAAFGEVGRLWADSGFVDPTGRYHVFFDSRGADEDRAERATLLALIDFLGLERVEAPADAPTGEVHVRTEPRLEAECGRWA